MANGIYTTLTDVTFQFGYPLEIKRKEKDSASEEPDKPEVSVIKNRSNNKSVYIIDKFAPLPDVKHNRKRGNKIQNKAIEHRHKPANTPASICSDAISEINKKSLERLRNMDSGAESMCSSEAIKPNSSVTHAERYAEFERSKCHNGQTRPNDKNQNKEINQEHSTQHATMTDRQSFHKESVRIQHDTKSAVDGLKKEKKKSSFSLSLADIVTITIKKK